MIKSTNDVRYRALIAHLKATREALGYSVRELAVLIDEDHLIVHRIETGEKKLTVQEFAQYCVALKLDPSEVVRLLY